MHILRYVLFRFFNFLGMKLPFLKKTNEIVFDKNLQLGNRLVSNAHNDVDYCNRRILFVSPPHSKNEK